jgi:hypothetical protein
MTMLSVKTWALRRLGAARTPRTSANPYRGAVLPE